jgi:hypothetical protein
MVVVVEAADQADRTMLTLMEELALTTLTKGQRRLMQPPKHQG